MSKILALIVLSSGTIFAQNNTQLETATLRLEHNVTDKDLEVVIEAKSVTEGLTKLTVIGPDGKNIVDLKGPPLLGLRHFSFETPEPKELSSIKKAYPEGEYKFVGESVSGVKTTGQATFNHNLLQAVSIISPEADQEGIKVKNFKIEWSPVKDAVGYVLSLEQMQSETNFSTRLPGNTTSFVVPDGFLVAGSEYTLGLGAIAKNGNITFIETSFTTEK